MVTIPFVDLKAQYHSIEDEINTAISRVILSGNFVLGPEVQSFEEEMASYCGVAYAIGVASGTDALYLSLLACGVKPGDEVITTAFTYIATAEVIKHCGAVPVFVDIDPKTYNIDPSGIEKKISKRTRAIILVHLYGQACAMDDIIKIARKQKLKVIEDCAQALGAEYKGEKVGTLGHIGCLSFFPANNLGAYGDGGMVVTNDKQVADKVRILRFHGSPAPYQYVTDGFNSRLDALQAAILRVKLKHLDEWIKSRSEKAALYSRLLESIKGIDAPFARERGKHSYNYYTICVSGDKLDRNNLNSYLHGQAIQTVVFYPRSLHLQDPYKKFKFKKNEFKVSEWAQDRVISLPIYPELTEAQINQIVAEIRNYTEGV